MDKIFDRVNVIEKVKELKNSKLFITGGTGFIGKWLLLFIDFLNKTEQLNCSVTVLSRNYEKFIKENKQFALVDNLSFIEGDIRDFSLGDKSFDYVIHAATDVANQNKEDEYSVIVDGTKHLLAMCEKANVKRILYISSGAVYGVQPPEMSHICETHKCNPVTAYGKGKLEAEKLCLNSGIDTVIARCFAFVGPYLPLDKHFAIGNFIQSCLKKESIVIKGDGTPYRSYMYGGDLAQWLWTILLKGKTAEAYNVGSDQAISIGDLAKRVRDCLAPELPIVIKQKPDEKNKPSRYVPNIEKSKALNLKIITHLSEAIQSTLLPKSESL